MTSGPATGRRDADLHLRPGIAAVELAEQTEQVDQPDGGQSAGAPRASQPTPHLGYCIASVPRDVQRDPGTRQQGQTGIGEQHPFGVPVE
ncbi:hypothetical protein [Streptomyces sp. NPDC000851]